MGFGGGRGFVPEAPPGESEEIEVIVPQATDDCQKGKFKGAWFFGTAYGYNSAGRSGVDYRQMGCGMRFQNVPVPSGATITEAKLKFRAYSSEGALEIKTRIRGELDANPGTFTDQANFDGRTRTTACVDWDAIEAWTVPNDYDSIDFKAVMQEIIDLAGWESNNALVLFWDDFDDRTTLGGANARFAQSYDSVPAQAPRLIFKYTL